VGVLYLDWLPNGDEAVIICNMLGIRPEEAR
jgi:hypothetical protein